MASTNFTTGTVITSDWLNDVNSIVYNNGVITTDKLADNAVTQAKMADNSVGTAELINSNVTTDKLASAAVTNSKIANNAVALNNLLNGGYELGFRNKITNGAMLIDQRNGGSAVTPSTDWFVADRFQYNASQASKVTLQQQATTVPPEFAAAAKFTVASAVTPGTTDYFSISQVINFKTVADFRWGTGAAQPVYLSFMVRTSVAGTYSGTLSTSLSGSTRQIAFTYSVSTANSWRRITIPIISDTGGASFWDFSNISNSQTLNLNLCLGAGSGRLTTAGVWSTVSTSSASFGATSTTQWISTAGATFYLTGVQLEIGSNPTTFDFRPYEVEYKNCLLEYEKVNILTAGGVLTVMQATSSSAAEGGMFPYSPKTSTPAITFNSVTPNATTATGTNAGGTLTPNVITPTGFSWKLTGATGLVAGNAVGVAVPFTIGSIGISTGR